ncbi:putative antirestriction adenine methyltransferase [Streptacidiphilus cavernicola]|uniref:N-acetyltransferase domain-containing protein n=1 Tax=Streptacidiphilus cavernicola TaxID=3342716 RepID=A0ABV6VY78_9ACTN
MFQGTIPPEMRAIVHEHARHWPAGSDVYVGCSGNLTIERTLDGMGHRLHSNDVNPYSCALGWRYSGQEVPFTVKDASRELLGWLDPYLSTPSGALAVLMLGTRFLDFVGKPLPYHQRMVAAYRAQFDRMHAETVGKLDAVTLKLDSFYAGDVLDHLRGAPPNAPVASFPPFWAAGYETMFRGITTHFDWPEPEYPMLDDEGKEEIIRLVADRPHWLLGLHFKHADLEPYRVGYVRLTPRAMPIWVYAHPGTSRYIGPSTKTEPVLMPKIRAREQVTGPLTLHPLTAGQFASLRAQFLDPRIAPGTPSLAVAVASQGRIIGSFAFLPPKFEADTAYLMSDFPVAWSAHKRLSKLIVMAALSDEARTLLQRAMNRRLNHVTTTAFSDNPVSQKYGRGVPGMKLTKRAPCEDGQHTWQLQYGAPLGQWTLAQGLELWLRKHAGVMNGVMN